MKSAAQIIKAIKPTLGTEVKPFTPETPQPMPPSPKPSNPERPCATAWQRKWLRLDVTCPEVQEMATECERWLLRYYLGNTRKSLLVLAGHTGCGKTKTAYKVAEWARGAGGTIVVESWPEVADGFKEGCYGVIGDMIEAGLLILDDVGAEHDPSKNGQDKLCQILSRRERKQTLITTNIAPDQWMEFFEARITDRLFRNSVHVDLSGAPSFALKGLLGVEV